MNDHEKLKDSELGEVAGGLKSNESIATEVIEGKWGNGQDRINRLLAAGYDPYAIQQLVNALLKQPKANNNTYYRDPYLG